MLVEFSLPTVMKPMGASFPWWVPHPHGQHMEGDARCQTPGEDPDLDAGRQMVLRPAADLRERRDQSLPRVRERVFDRDGRALVDRSGDQAGFDQVAQTRGEHRVADSLDRPGKLAEAGWTLAEVAEDDAGPASPEQVERADQRRVAARAGFGGTRSSSFRLRGHAVNATDSIVDRVLRAATVLLVACSMI